MIMTFSERFHPAILLLKAHWKELQYLSLCLLVAMEPIGIHTYTHTNVYVYILLLDFMHHMQSIVTYISLFSAEI